MAVPDPKQKENGKRMRLLRRQLGFLTATAFADYLQIKHSRWSNAELGYGVSSQVVELLLQRVPGTTVEWIRDGDLSGVSARFKHVITHDGFWRGVEPLAYLRQSAADPPNLPYTFAHELGHLALEVNSAAAALRAELSRSESVHEHPKLDFLRKYMHSYQDLESTALAKSLMLPHQKKRGP